MANRTEHKSLKYPLNARQYIYIIPYKPKWSIHSLIFKMGNDNFILSTTIIVLLVHIASSLSVNAACNKEDRAALLAFKDSFPDGTFTHLYGGWMANSTRDCCEWNYVGCDSNTGRVTSLTFGYGGDPLDPPLIYLNGTIPSSIGNLTALESLTIEQMPELVGPLPLQLSNLKKLQKLSINNCQISGTVPSFLSEMPDLANIELVDNVLVGKIPASLANLVNLSLLDLSRNKLTGTIPPNIFSKLPKPSLAFLYLSNNRLEGSIPQSFAKVDFFACYLQKNKLTGDASLLFGRNKTVDTISIYSNKFRFDLSTVEYPLNLTYLDISKNEIYGSISNQITEASKLSTAVFSYNKLCGRIPSGGQYNPFRADYDHNKCLCGAPLKPCK